MDHTVNPMFITLEDEWPIRNPAFQNNLPIQNIFNVCSHLPSPDDKQAARNHGRRGRELPPPFFRDVHKAITYDLIMKSYEYSRQNPIADSLELLPSFWSARQDRRFLSTPYWAAMLEGTVRAHFLLILSWSIRLNFFPS